MNKIALITGASSGIGKACAELLASKGYSLILCARRMEKLNELGKELRGKGAEVYLLSFDVSIAENVQNALDSLPPEWKSIEVLINNAGLSLGLDPIHRGALDDWERMIDTNIKGFLYVARHAAEGMVNRKKGHIINIGSIAGKEVYPNGNVYCATKFAVDALNKGMRSDLLSYGIKVSAVHPGAVETEFSEVRFHGDVERAKNVYRGFDPLQAIDIAEAVYFILSRPAHVNVNELTIMPKAQANAQQLLREV